MGQGLAPSQLTHCLPLDIEGAKASELERILLLPVTQTTMRDVNAPLCGMLHAAFKDPATRHWSWPPVSLVEAESTGIADHRVVPQANGKGASPSTLQSSSPPKGGSSSASSTPTKGASPISKAAIDRENALEPIPTRDQMFAHALPRFMGMMLPTPTYRGSVPRVGHLLSFVAVSIPTDFPLQDFSPEPVIPVPLRNIGATSTGTNGNGKMSATSSFSSNPLAKQTNGSNAESSDVTGTGSPQAQVGNASMIPITPSFIAAVCDCPDALVVGYYRYSQFHSSGAETFPQPSPRKGKKSDKSDQNSPLGSADGSNPLVGVIDYYQFKSFCHEAKATVLFQAVNLYTAWTTCCANNSSSKQAAPQGSLLGPPEANSPSGTGPKLLSMQQSSPTPMTVAAMALDKDRVRPFNGMTLLRCRFANLPQLRFFQKLYRLHVAPVLRSLFPDDDDYEGVTVAHVGSSSVLHCWVHPTVRETLRQAFLNAISMSTIDSATILSLSKRKETSAGTPTTPNPTTIVVVPPEAAAATGNGPNSNSSTPVSSSQSFSILDRLSPLPLKSLRCASVNRDNIAANQALLSPFDEAVVDGKKRWMSESVPVKAVSGPSPPSSQGDPAAAASATGGNSLSNGSFSFHMVPRNLTPPPEPIVHVIPSGEKGTRGSSPLHSGAGLGFPRPQGGYSPGLNNPGSGGFGGFPSGAPSAAGGGGLGVFATPNHSNESFSHYQESVGPSNPHSFAGPATGQSDFSNNGSFSLATAPSYYNGNQNQRDSMSSTKSGGVNSRPTSGNYYSINAHPSQHQSGSSFGPRGASPTTTHPISPPTSTSIIYPPPVHTRNPSHSRDSIGLASDSWSSGFLGQHLMYPNPMHGNSPISHHSGSSPQVTNGGVATSKPQKPTQSSSSSPVHSSLLFATPQQRPVPQQPGQAPQNSSSPTRNSATTGVTRTHQPYSPPTATLADFMAVYIPEGTPVQVSSGDGNWTPATWLDVNHAATLHFYEDGVSETALLTVKGDLKLSDGAGAIIVMASQGPGKSTYVAVNPTAKLLPTLSLASPHIQVRELFLRRPKQLPAPHQPAEISCRQHEERTMAKAFSG
jgi:hypothetical protein